MVHVIHLGDHEKCFIKVCISCMETWKCFELFFGISIDLFNVLWIIGFLFLSRLFSCFPYKLWLICFSFSNGLLVYFPYMLWVSCFPFSRGFSLDFPCMFQVLGTVVLLVPICFTITLSPWYFTCGNIMNFIYMPNVNSEAVRCHIYWFNNSNRREGWIWLHNMNW